MNLDRRLLRELGLARKELALTVGLGLLAGVLLVLQARLLSQIVGSVFLRGASLAGVQPSLFALLGLAVARAGFVWGSEAAAGRGAGRIKQALRERLVAHLLALGPSFAGKERSGELSNTITEGVEALDAFFSQYLPQIALAALIPLTILTFAFPLDPLSGVVLLVTAPLIPLFMVLIGNLADSLTAKQWTELGRMSAHFLDALQGLSTLKVLGRSREQAAAIGHVSDRFRMATMSVLRVAFLSALVLELVATISTAVVAVQIGLRLLAGRLGFDEAFFVLLLAPEFYLPLRMLGTRFHAGMAGIAASRRIYEVLDTVALPAHAPADIMLPQVDRLVFDHVSVSFQEGQRAALQNLGLEIRCGEKLALVGPSGAGKSTVAHLLLRFIEPDRGSIRVGGRCLAEVSPTAWRRQIAWVPQMPYLFHASVLDNIRLARPDATLDEVVAAARRADAHDFVAVLPQGYDTIVGERGARLSGGQAQRLALARAFLKDAPLVILDEATVNLDPVQRERVQGVLQELLAGRTALIIAHDLGMALRADRIAVMQAGRVVASGSHAELLAQGGLYRDLVQSAGGQGGA